MELRKEAASPSAMGLSPDDFLSGEDLRQQPVPNPFRGPMPQTNVPDLHTVDLNSTPQTRQNIMQQNPISSSQLRDEIIDEKIKQDLSSLKQQPTTSSTFNEPKDVLKKIIASGDYQETVRLYGHDWTLRALDQRDLLLATEMLKTEVLDSDTAKYTYLIFTQVLFAIESLDGKPIYDWFPEVKISDFSKREEYNLAVRNALKRYLEHTPPQVINDFYEAYQKIDDKRTKALELLKNS